MTSQTLNSDPITITLKRFMDERGLTYRALGELTRSADPAGRGVTHAYLSGLTSGREYPSRRSMELIATSLGIEPDHSAEHRLATLRRELNGRDVGFDAAWQRYRELVG